MGILVGLGIACFSPHEPTYAATIEAAGRFSVLTIPMQNEADSSPDGVIVVDYMTGQP